MTHPHENFQDLSLLYGDFNRPVFLEAVLHWFVESASSKELAALRSAIRDRAKTLKQSVKQGRPRAEHDRNWLRLSAQIVWQREILHWTWRRIATSAGMKPTEDSIRTLERRRDRYALLVWHVLPSYTDHQALKSLLGFKPIQRALRSRALLPFDTRPEESKRLVVHLMKRNLPRP